MINSQNFDLVTPNQELLLKAALLSGEEAITAWRKWQDASDWKEYLEPGSFRLLPLLYINLRKQSVNEPAMEKLKGIYRHAWSQNQILFHETAKIVEQLQSAGIETMLLKGISLSLLYYKNNGARPMTDIDILVPLEKVYMAIELLKKVGWTSPVPLTEQDLSYRHAIHLNNRFGKELDLHWRPFQDCRNEYGKDFWNDALPVKIININCLAPNPTNMLFHTIIHGVAWNLMPTIRWVADAIFLINSNDFKIDWQRLANLAEKHHLCLRLKTGLRYLNEKFPYLIPPVVINKVIGLPVYYLEKIEHRCLISSRNKERNGPYTAFCRHLCRFHRLNAGKRFFPLLAFYKSLKWKLNARNSRDLLYKGIRRTADMLYSKP
ncbi:MAG: nucleotidyltransferase family protein [Syntrophaceae bacterium]|nr:nucleotidyltransferase family protein [Syntrophaceae bacterium]